MVKTVVAIILESVEDDRDMSDPRILGPALASLLPMPAPHSMIEGKNLIITGGTFNQTVARTALSIGTSIIPRVVLILSHELV
jgi:hypothetical protein